MDCYQQSKKLFTKNNWQANFAVTHEAFASTPTNNKSTQIFATYMKIP